MCFYFPPTPINITHLTLGNYFNQDIKNYIPISVINLTLKGALRKDITNCILNNITYLTLPKGYPYNNLNSKCQISFQ